jgi:acetyl esterase/lipase
MLRALLPRLALGLAPGLAACTPAQLLNATVPVGGLTITHDVAYGGLPRQRLDIYRPAGAPPGAPGLPVVVFFYGGSWNSGRKGMYPFVAATLARSGAVVVVPDYRLYPEVEYPDFLRDCARAVAWTQAHPAQTGSGSLFLMGHSAGAYNAAMLGLDPAWLRAAGADPGRIAGVIGLAGPYDFLPITDPEIRPIFPDAGPDTQPITYAGPHAPPLLLLTGDEDAQVRPRNSTALAARIDTAGGHAQVIRYKGLGHIGLVTAIAPAFQWRAPVLRDVVAFLRRTPSPARADVAKPGPNQNGSRLP